MQIRDHADPHHYKLDSNVEIGLLTFLAKNREVRSPKFLDYDCVQSPPVLLLSKRNMMNASPNTWKF